MSLRARLLAGVVVVGIVLVLAALVITRTTESYLISQIDDQLRNAGPPARTFGLASPPTGDGQTPPMRDPISSIYLSFVTDEGEVEVLATPNLSVTDPPRPAIDPAEVLASRDQHGEQPFTVGSEGSDLRYRIMVLGPSRAGGAVVVGLPLDGVDAAIRRLVEVEIVATAAVMAVLALVTYWVLRLGVRPIKQMTATATAIADGDLSHRAPESIAGVEAGQLASALNRMLEHLQDALAQRARSEDELRRFVADASHELRTPITTIRGYAELYRNHGLDEPAELDEAMRRTEDEAIRMGALVDDLLLLARLDQGRPLERRPVDLAVLIDDTVRDARAVAPARAISAQHPDELVAIGDDARLRQVLANLVRNALVHTPERSAIHIRAHRDGDHAVVEVRDEGPGMAPEVAGHVFERFYRADPSRSRSRGGSGLGLSIAQATVGGLGGTIALDTAPDRGTTVTVRLPLSTSRS